MAAVDRVNGGAVRRPRRSPARGPAGDGRDGLQPHKGLHLTGYMEIDPETMKPVIRLPARVLTGLSNLKGFDDRCHLAGGAVCNALFDRPVKDWDIFIPADTISPKLAQASIGGRLRLVNEHGAYHAWNDAVERKGNFVQWIHLPG